MPFPVVGLAEWMYSRANDLFGWLVSLGLSGKLKWIAKDWMTFVIGIVLFGIAIDVLVHFVRYRPDRKWRRWIRRLRNRQPGRGEGASHAGGRAARQSEPAAGEYTSRPAAPSAPRSAPTIALGGARVGADRTRREGEELLRQPTRRLPSPVSSAELFQPAPPAEEYDAEPSTAQPARRTPNWKGE